MTCETQCAYSELDAMPASSILECGFVVSGVVFAFLVDGGDNFLLDDADNFAGT